MRQGGESAVGPSGAGAPSLGWTHARAADWATPLPLPPPGSAYSFQGGSGGGGGQLGHGNDFDYWSPTAVEWLQLSETEMVRQEPEGGGALAWRVLQVACGLNHTAAVVELPGVTL